MRSSGSLFALCALVAASAALAAPSSPAPLSPAALATTRDGQTVFVACATGQRVLRLDLATRQVVAAWPMPAAPLGLALAPDEANLFVTCAGSRSEVAIVELANGRIAATLPAGHTAMAPVVSPDGKTLYVCNRFEDDVSFLDLATRQETHRVKVQREPVAAALTQDGRFLLVANLLHQGPADGHDVAAVVSVIDTAAAKVVKELKLPNGSGSLNDIAVSPDGKHAVVTHILSRFHLPTTQLDRGWMNTNAKTLIDLDRMEVVNTMLLDSIDRGAANPWGVAWSGDGKTVIVAHAGTHEISVVDVPGLLAKLAKVPREVAPGQPVDYSSATRVQADVPNDLAFLVGVRQRLKLPPDELGPRAVVMVGSLAITANYFSDTLGVVDLAVARPRWESIPLGPKPVMSQARLGEFYFNDAGICFQGWQSCASCHPGDGRVDALNWDLLNDGIGNPKNNKSLLLTFATPPSMSLGVRETPEAAVRAGIRHILFTVQPPEVAASMDAYIKALRPVPSPRLVNGALSPAGERGKQLFHDPVVNCAACHPAGLYTDLQAYDVGTAGRFEKAGTAFDTPTLVELWRTAPYLHDGSAATMREVLTTRNPKDQHGKTSHLTEEQINDLVEYLLSL